MTSQNTGCKCGGKCGKAKKDCTCGTRKPPLKGTNPANTNPGKPDQATSTPATTTPAT